MRCCGCAGTKVMGSAPLTLKCPACMRGMWRKGRVVRGIARSRACTGEKIPPRLTHQRAVPRWKVKVKCWDCNHEWWTVHADWADNYRAIGRSTTGGCVYRKREG